MSEKVNVMLIIFIMVEWWDNEPIIKRWKANYRYDIEVRANDMNIIHRIFMRGIMSMKQYLN